MVSCVNSDLIRWTGTGVESATFAVGSFVDVDFISGLRSRYLCQAHLIGLLSPVFELPEENAYINGSCNSFQTFL
jgi:hypothetical protein